MTSRGAHEVPFHSHVSSRLTPAVSKYPPKSTTTWRCESYTIAWARRGNGPGTLWSVQADPFQVQVWLLGVMPGSVIPPKSTVTPRAASYAIAWSYRGDGPATS